MGILSTSDVLDHHIKAFVEFDLEGILADYATGAILFTPNGPLKGREALKPLFQGLFQNLRSPGLRLRCSTNGSTAITLTFCGLGRAGTIHTNSQPTRLWCGAGK
jgi:hypothetical protein